MVSKLSNAEASQALPTTLHTSSQLALLTLAISQSTGIGGGGEGTASSGGEGEGGGGEGGRAGAGCEELEAHGQSCSDVVYGKGAASVGVAVHSMITVDWTHRMEFAVACTTARGCKPCRLCICIYLVLPGGRLLRARRRPSCS